MIMKKSKADLMLHPVRMKIIQLLASGNNYTSQQMGEMLPDVPQATLYRHINLLVTAGLLRVVETNQVENGASLSPEDLNHATREDHMNYFMSFLSGIIGDFGKYLSQERIDFLKDGVGYRQAQFYMSDAEFDEFVKSLREIFGKAAPNTPAPGRRLRSVTSIFIPETPKPSD
jgi:hypothetical protein